MEAEKRKRTANFRNDEVGVLVDLVIDKKDKRSDAIMWTEKQQAWIEISENLASITGLKRDWKMLRNKYEMLKKTVRRKAAKIRQERLTTGFKFIYLNKTLGKNLTVI